LRFLVPFLGFDFKSISFSEKHHLILLEWFSSVVEGNILVAVDLDQNELWTEYHFKF
jgi:hypothetical protein